MKINKRVAALKNDNHGPKTTKYWLTAIICEEIWQMWEQICRHQVGFH